MLEGHFENMKKEGVKVMMVSRTLSKTQMESVFLLNMVKKIFSYSNPRQAPW